MTDGKVYGEISAPGLRERLEGGERRLLLDVREEWEFHFTRIEGSILMPLSELSSRMNELNPEGEAVVICHHRVRSAHAAQTLVSAGFKRVLNLDGGLEAYSGVDPQVRRYKGLGERTSIESGKV